MSSALLSQLKNRVRNSGIKHADHGVNIVAFSGGVDSSLVAALVYNIFPENSYACIGISPSLAKSQLQLAREIAKHIGIPLKEVMTDEGRKKEYIENKGMSCFHCKTSLYSALQTVTENANLIYNTNYNNRKNDDDIIIDQQEQGKTPKNVMLFNGTNADDKIDKTRVGLKAASNFGVSSPIDEITKNQVRLIANEISLPNWNVAASPCLRSRLAFGVPATEDYLLKVEKSEEIVKEIITIQEHNNLRVRVMSKNRAMIEVDEELLYSVNNKFDILEKNFLKLGFSSIDVRKFKTGSVAASIKMINI